MDRLPPLRLLTIFDAVRRLGSMQAAAGELNVTRSAVSQAIRALEDHLGVPLMDRTVKPSVPTDAGLRLAQAIAGGLAQIANAIEDIRFQAGLDHAQVTVSCTLGMATHWLMPRLGGFYAAHPDIMVNVQAPPSELPGVTPGIDVALRYGTTGWSDGPSERLFAEIACPVAHPDVMARLAGGPAALVTAPLVHVHAPRSHNWAGWPDYFAARALPAHKGSKQTFDNYIHAVQAAIDRRGVMLGWRSITDGLVAEGRLVAMDGAACDFGTAYWATLAPESRSKPAVTTFTDWLMAEAARWQPEV